MTPDEVYDYAYDLRTAEKRLADAPDIRAEDRKLIQAFMKHIRPQGISTGRQAKYINLMLRCAQLIQVPFRRAKRRDIEDLITRLSDHEIVTRGPDGKERRRHYSPATMADFRMAVKRFQKFVRYGDTDLTTPFPDEVRWFRNVIKLSDRREPEFFTDADIEALVRAADSLRDKALIALAGELGTRVSEILLVRLGDLRFDDAGALLHIRRGKTGARTLRLISSVAYLADYISMHPFRDTDPEAPLWLTTSPNHSNEPMGWVACSRMLKAVAVKAGLKKQRIHMYMFRHGSATRNAKYLSDAELRLMYGWSPTSRMPAVYIHLSGGDLDLKYQQVYGSGKPVEIPRPGFAPPVCPRCQEKASPGMRFCPKCATPLEPGERAKATAEEAVRKNEISELRRLVEKSLGQQPPASGEGRGSAQGQTS